MLSQIFLIILCVFAIAALINVIVWTALFLRPRRKILSELKDQKDIIMIMDKNANFYGLESKGHGQVRGNGILFIDSHKRQLSFIKVIPRMRIDIPLEHIFSLDTPRQFLNKTNFRPLLRVNFEIEHGAKDSVAWLLSSDGLLQLFLQKLQGLVKDNTQ